ncbi:MAG: beta-galactosidase, partial [Clostridia bacterium]|nr:beta-galactosidase [Clostridia bacterium]
MNNIVEKYLPMEDQTLRGMYNDPTRMTGFVDLRDKVDDKTVLKNPHKGWFIHYIDNGFRRPAYRDSCEKGDYFTDFPGLNHLYIRFDWSDIEREKGVYNFSPIDDIMEEWGPYGYRFSLRMCCFETGYEYATPKYVFEEGAKGIMIPGSGPQPDYGDPIFLAYLEKFVEALAKKYDGDPRIEIVDIGSYGTWGEGHTSVGDFVIYPPEVVKRHFDIHAKYFTKTFLLCNDDHIIGRMAHGEEEVNDMLDYVDARGFGIQDDSICCGGYAEDMCYDTMRSRWAFDKLYKNAPACIELEHYSMVRPDHDMYFRGGFTIAEALKHAHATFAGFHAVPRKWLRNELYLTEYCANRLGYWFFIPSAM